MLEIKHAVCKSYTLLKIISAVSAELDKDSVADARSTF